jgi:hypothetical protein
MYENLLKILPNSEKFCKIWKILKAVLMQACDLEYLENLKYLEDFAFLCKILHDNAGLYKIIQNFEMRVFLMSREPEEPQESQSSCKNLPPANKEKINL